MPWSLRKLLRTGHLIALLLMASVPAAILCMAETGAYAQEQPEPPVTSPESLLMVLSEGAQTLREQIGGLRTLVVEKQDTLAQSEKAIADLKVSVSTFKASLAVTSLPAHRVEEVVRGFDARQGSINTRLSGLRQERDELVGEQAAWSASLSTLEAEMNNLESVGGDAVWTPEMKGTYEAYRMLAGIRTHLLDLAMGTLDRRARLLQEGQELLEGIQPQLNGLKESWRLEITKRETRLSPKEQAVKIWETFLMLPERVLQWLTHLISSGDIGAFIQEHLALLLGLLLVITLIGWGCRRLSRVFCPLFRKWWSETEDVTVHAFWSLMDVLVRSLFSIGFVVWVALVFQTFGLLELDSAKIILYSVAALVAMRLSIRLVEGFFSGREAGGVLHLDAATAAFYRKHLKLLSVYFFLGILSLSIAGALGFHAASSAFLEHLFDAALQVFALWVLRPRHVEGLFRALPGPSWGRWLKATKGVRMLVMSLLTVIVLSDLLGYQGLSFFIARSMTYSEAVVILWALSMLGGRVVLHFLLHPEHGWLARRTENQTGLLHRLYDLARHASAVLLTAAASLAVLLAWSVKTDDLMRILDVLTWGISLGPVRLTPVSVALVALALYAAGWLRRVSRTLVETRVLPRTGWDTGIQYTISMVLQYFIVFMGGLIALSIIGFPLTNLALVAGALGVGVGFGLQDIVKNFVSGLILLFERPIRVGDMLVIDGQWGEVKGIRMRSTVFQTFDKYVLIIPNSEMISSKILNWTHFGRTPNRLTLKVGVSYASDVQEVTRVLLAVCKAHPRVLDSPPPQVSFSAYGDSSLDFTIWVHVWLPEDRVPVTHEINTAIFEAFRERSIEIPFPQRDLHLKTLPEGMNPGGWEKPTGGGSED